MTVPSATSSRTLVLFLSSLCAARVEGNFRRKIDAGIAQTVMAKSASTCVADEGWLVLVLMLVFVFVLVFALVLVSVLASVLVLALSLSWVMDQSPTSKTRGYVQLHTDNPYPLGVTLTITSATTAESARDIKVVSWIAAVAFNSPASATNEFKVKWIKAVESRVGQRLM